MAGEPKIASKSAYQDFFLEQEIEIDLLPRRAFGWHRFIGTQWVDETQMRALLDEVNKSEYDHTWRWFVPSPGQSLVDQLIAFENKKRPTHIFCYYGEKEDGTRELVGAGSVALSINSRFPHTGFPVIARGYILERFRTYRLYFPTIRHRFQYLVTSLGAGLRGIHLGSSNVRVFQTIKKGIFGFPFLYIGNESLNPKSPSSIVRDFLWISDAYRKDLLSAVGGQSNGAGVLRDQITKFLENRFLDTDYKKTLDALRQVDAINVPGVSVGDPVRMLMDFMAAVPLIETDTPMDQELTDPTGFELNKRV